MRYLFVFHSIGTEMRGIASWLARQPDTTVLLAMDRGQEDFDIPKVEKILLKKPDARMQRDDLPDYMIQFMHRAQKTWYSLRSISSQGGDPDIILTYSSTGTAFGLQDIFPQAFIVNYLVGTNAFSQTESRAMRLLQCMQICQSRACYSFTDSTRKTLPEIYWRKVEMAPLSVDTEYFTRVKGYNFIKNSSNLIVFWLKKFGFPDFAKWLNTIIKIVTRKGNISAAILAPNLGMLKAAEDMLAGLPKDIAGRIWMKCSPNRIIRREVFSAADLFVSPSREINLEMLESMSCGTPVMTSAADEGLVPDSNCLKLPSKSILDAIEECLEDTGHLESIAFKGRLYVAEKHSVEAVVPVHIGSILEAREKSLSRRRK